MTPHDPTLLSAYLDDELAPEARLRLEAEMESDPRLARRLRELARLREALANLPRPPAPAGLSFRVRSRIEQAEAQRARQARERSVQLRRVLVLAPITSAAAALLVIWAVEALSHREPALPIPASLQGTPSVAEAGPRPEAPAPPVVAELKGGAPEPMPASTPLDRQRIADEAQLRELLARPEAGRIVVRLDRLDDASLARVRSAVVELVRSVPHHAQLEVPAALALDPAHPGPAVVFAVPLEADEPERLLAHLGARFPGLPLEVQPVPPAILAQLGETVGVAFGEAEDAASPLVDIGEHPLHAGKRDPQPSADRVAVFGPPVDPGVGVVLPPAHAEAGPAADRPADEPEPEPQAPAESHRESSVYLVWVVAS